MLSKWNRIGFWVTLVSAAAGIHAVYGQSPPTTLLDYMPPDHAAVVEEKFPGATVIEGGIRFLETRAGEGPYVEKGDRVEAIYTGRLLDGTIFNRKTGQFHTYRFRVGAEPREIIRGWEMAMPLMQAGGEYIVAIPAEFAYRDTGRRGQVPPYATVIFEIEILQVERAAR